MLFVRFRCDKMLPVDIYATRTEERNLPIPGEDESPDDESRDDASSDDEGDEPSL